MSISFFISQPLQAGQSPNFLSPQVESLARSRFLWQVLLHGKQFIRCYITLRPKHRPKIASMRSTGGLSCRPRLPPLLPRLVLLPSLREFSLEVLPKKQPHRGRQFGSSYAFLSESESLVCAGSGEVPDRFAIWCTQPYPTPLHFV